MRAPLECPAWRPSGHCQLVAGSDRHCPVASLASAGRGQDGGLPARGKGHWPASSQMHWQLARARCPIRGEPGPPRRRPNLKGKMHDRPGSRGHSGGMVLPCEPQSQNAANAPPERSPTRPASGPAPGQSGAEHRADDRAKPLLPVVRYASSIRRSQTTDRTTHETHTENAAAWYATALDAARRAAVRRWTRSTEAAAHHHGVRGIPCRLGIPCRVGYHAAWDTVPRGIAPARKSARVVTRGIDAGDCIRHGRAQGRGHVA